MICEEINEGIKQYYVRSQDRRKVNMRSYTANKNLQGFTE